MEIWNEWSNYWGAIPPLSMNFMHTAINGNHYQMQKKKTFLNFLNGARCTHTLTHCMFTAIDNATLIVELSSCVFDKNKKKKIISLRDESYHSIRTALSH